MNFYPVTTTQADTVLEIALCPSIFVVAIECPREQVEGAGITLVHNSERPVCDDLVL